jgi:hypothetical protein
MRVLRRNCGREVSLLVPLLAQSRDPPTQGVLTGHKVALPSRVPTSTILERTVERCTGVQAYCHNGNDTEELSEVQWMDTSLSDLLKCAIPPPHFTFAFNLLNRQN